MKLTRRDVAALAGSSAIAASLASVSPAAAYQGNMERALGALQDAFGSLQAATPNKGGHRERAMDLIQRAIAQVQEGIDFANANGGGGGPPY
ncbi:hypothetical protein [Methylocella silvestris]|nr:hypothetical protein [Methylocella silvestris]